MIAELAQSNPRPAVVSGDARILRNPAERQVLRDTNLTFFLFAEAWQNLPWAERAWKTVRIWPLIVEAAHAKRPSVFRVPIAALKVEFLSPTADLGRRR